jgi:hypothetical protein
MRMVLVARRTLLKDEHRCESGYERDPGEQKQPIRGFKPKNHLSSFRKTRHDPTPLAWMWGVQHKSVNNRCERGPTPLAGMTKLKPD